MDPSELIKDLQAEKERLERAIAALESLASSRAADAPAGEKQLHVPRRRGRKSMGCEERQRVSERMAAYWAAKRKGRGVQPASQVPQPHLGSDSGSEADPGEQARQVSQVD